MFFHELLDSAVISDSEGVASKDMRVELDVNEVHALIMAMGIAWAEARTESDAAFYLGIAKKLYGALRD